MQISNIFKISVILLLLAGMSAAKTRTAKHSSYPSAGPHSKTLHKTSAKGHRTRRGAWKRHGQQDIRDDRASEIQQALIREKYLDGTPSGQWDTRTQQAMSRYQADNGWQSKVTPDSRAIIKLGLGPSHTQDIRPTGTPVSAAVGAAVVTPGSAGNSRYKR